VTQWVENPEIGRERGPVGLLRAWIDVLVRPRAFFHTKVAPGEQAPGITFAAAVVFAMEASRIAVFGGNYPVIGSQPTLSAVFWVGFVTVLIAPAGIHLVAAVQTLLLMVAVDDRAGISETVQVICYALTPCVLAGVPNVFVQAGVTFWGGGLLVVGLSIVHDVNIPRALGVGAIPAVFVFGYGLGGNDAVFAAIDILQSFVVAGLLR